MIIPYEVFEENKRFKKSIECAEDEVDKILYKAAKAYSNGTVTRTKEVMATVMEQVKISSKKL